MHSGVSVQPEKADKNQLLEIIWKQNASFFILYEWNDMMLVCETFKLRIKVVDNMIIIYSDDRKKKKRKNAVILQN